MIRLLAVDVDGTLLDSQGSVPPENRAALAAAVDAGVEVTLVTGRSFHFTRPVADLLDLPVTLIVNNGAIVKSGSGATKMRRLLPRATAQIVLDATGAFADSVALVFDRPDERQIVYERMDWSHPHRRGYYEKNLAFITPATAGLADALVEDPIQVMFNGGVAPMRELAGALRAAPGAAAYAVAITEYERRDFSLIDVNAAGCSKGSTLARWAGQCGLDRRQVMAVGDNLNDLEMLAFAGTAVVMGNATGAMKALGYRVTGTNDEGGLAAAVYTCVLDESSEAANGR
ncbi:MAG: HAD family phosphatase [Acidobacteria bacterium]|nr:HAD family phosphatase [Acidobacteriota bacterium]